MTDAVERVAAFRCPRCGNDASRGGLRYVEDISCARVVAGVENGRLRIDARYDTAGYDDGTNPRFVCTAFGVASDGRFSYCGHEWPAPKWLLPLIDFE